MSRLEPTYSPFDTDWPTLTVAQTIMFALRTKTPGKRLPNESKKDFQTAVLGLLLRMLNISHTRNTLVGNAFVRGVSGGERKRVSIAEMMCTNACVCAWDNSTRGLDASTALDYARSLRILTDIFRNTTFVSLYQAGEGIYELFDKVMVIDNGRQVYFGPREQARQYFIDLGFKDLKRQTSADYLTGCTDPNERQFAEGRSADNVPSTPEQLEEAYKKSSIYANVIKEREEYEQELKVESKARDEFERSVLESKQKGVRPKSPYTVGILAQIRALTIRQFQLRLQDRLGTWVQYVTSIAIAIIAGSCYLQLPQTSAGAFTRGGAIFIALLFNTFGAFVELPSQMQGRPIMFKQKNFTFYRPAVISIAGVLADTPINMSMVINIWKSEIPTEILV
jgi:ATP-binding cassette subfamily G (WHITE) protein 2 (SNQ2)